MAMPRVARQELARIAVDDHLFEAERMRECSGCWRAALRSWTLIGK